MLRLPRVTHAEMEHRILAEDAAARWTDAHAVMHDGVTAPRHEAQAAALEVLLKTSSEELVTFARMAHWMVRFSTPRPCVVCGCMSKEFLFPLHFEFGCSVFRG